MFAFSLFDNILGGVFVFGFTAIVAFIVYAEYKSSRPPKSKQFDASESKRDD